MTELSLKERLLRYLQKQNGWVASGEIQRIVAQKTSYTPQNVGRRLRELETEGATEVQYRKNHAWYRFAPQTPLKTHHSPSQPYSKTHYETVLLPEMLKLWNDQPQN